MGGLVLVFDLDGTLFEVRPGVQYDDPESIRSHVTPHEAACALVRRLHDAGHRVAYLTGRSEAVRAATQAQLDAAGLPPGELRMQRAWAGWVEMRLYKANHLRALGAALYVGDHLEDENAAVHAGVPFIHADAFRAGNLHVPRAREATA